MFNRNRSIGELYTFLSRDFIYTDPDKLLIFLDNHDVMRLYNLVNGNLNKYKMALKVLLTMRGIPQIYYGTEIGLAGGADHGQIRADFPGGFPGDTRNAFDRNGRDKKENEIFDFLRKIILIRREYQALQTGSLIHLPPVDEIYVYFRISDKQKLMIIINNNSYPAEFSLHSLSNQLTGMDYLLDVDKLEKINYNDDTTVPIPAYDVRIFELEPK